MKRFFALAALVLGLAACQTEPEGLDVNVGGEVDSTITVAISDSETRAKSALGAFDNVVASDEYTIRYILQVYYKGEPSKERLVKYSDETYTTFDVRLVPGRHYNFVVWADIVKEADKTDLHYNTTNLHNITLKQTWVAMDETRDAFTGFFDTEKEDSDKPYNGKMSINIQLTRPFAKLRVITTDMVELGNLGIAPYKGTVTYTTKHRESFNACNGNYGEQTKEAVTLTYNIASYEDNDTQSKVVFTDYFFANDDVVKFTMDIMEADGSSIKFNNFSTDIPVKRNFLTTIQGDILTDGNNIKVDVNDEFTEIEWPEENKSAEQLAYAAMFGGEVTLSEDVVLTQPLEIVEGANVVINLEGKTLTGAIELAEGAELTVNNGVIKNTDRTVSGITSNGDLTLNNVTIESARHGVRVESGNVVINGGEYKVAPISASTLHALNVGDDGTTANVVIKGGTFIGPKSTMADSGSAVNVRNGSSVVIEGGNFSGGKSKTLSGNITVKGGTFDQNPSSFLAAGYKVIEKDGKFVVVSNEVDTVVASKEDVQNALKDAVAAGETDIVIDANGANINLYYGLTKATVPAGTTVTIRNANVEGSCYGNGANGTVIFEGCTFNNSGAYSIHFDNGNGKVIFKNCDLYGWNSFGASLTSVEFENCSLTGNGTYALIRSYVDLTLTNCVINTSNANHNDAYSEGVETIAPATLTENNVTYVAENLEALKDAVTEENATVNVAAGDYTFPSSVAAGVTIKCEEGTVFTGKSSLNINGATVIGAEFKNENGIAVSGTINGTFKNCTFTGSEALRWCYSEAGNTTVFENCVINTDFRGFHYDNMNGDVIFRNCEINGFNAYGGDGTATFEGCTFGCDESSYNGLNIYSNTNLVNCTFNFVSGKTNFIDMEGTGKTLTITNCTATFDGVTVDVKNYVGGSKLADNTVVIE